MCGWSGVSSRGFSRGVFTGSRAAPEKKNKRRKQSSNKKRERIREENSATFEETKNLILNSMARMGQQVFVEGSDYGMENWIRNFNKLLDEFQQTLSTRGSLPQQFIDARAEASRLLEAKKDVLQLDDEIKKLNEEASDIRRSLSLNLSDIKSKKDELLKQRTAIQEELSRTRSMLSESKKKSESTSFFGRLFGKKDDGTIPALESKIATSESALNELESQITQLEMNERRATTDPPRLAEISKKIIEIQSVKQSLLQYKEEREKATRIMMEAISGLS